MVRFDSKALYAALDARRGAHGMTWRQVASATGVSATTMTRLRAGGRLEVDGMLAMVGGSACPSKRSCASHAAARGHESSIVSDPASA
jgi:hypothetical protein